MPDRADWLTPQLDLGTDDACKDDQRVVTSYWDTGWERQRGVYRAGSGCTADTSTWPKKTTTRWTQFDDDKLNTLVTDSGTATSPSSTAQLDMGSRRYGLDTTRFLQQDQFAGALADLGLAADALTQNRYGLAGGNPVSFVEVDGHTLATDGTGGAVTSPTPPPPSSEPKHDDTGTASSASSGSGVGGAAFLRSWQEAIAAWIHRATSAPTTAAH